MGRVAIVGAAQSGLEVAVDLLSNKKCLDSLTIFNKEPLIQQIEDSSFAEDQVFTSKGLERFVGLSNNIKLELIKQYRVTSDGASPETIRELYQLMYANKYAADAEIEIRLLNQTEVTGVGIQERGYSVCAQDSFSEKKISFSFDTIILATGYVQRFPDHLFSEELLQKAFFVNGIPATNENYELEYAGPGRIFLVNGCKHFHGVVDPNLSLSAWRAMKILSTITGKKHINTMNQMCGAI